MKKFICGVLVGLMLSGGAVWAAGGIRSAEYNANGVMFNGNKLQLSQPMISVIKDGETAASNYMPVRAVLEAMGYKVDWDGANVIVLDTNNAKIGLDTPIGPEGQTFRNLLLNASIDIDKVRTNPAYTEYKEMFDQLNLGYDVMLIIGADDYRGWVEGKDSSFDDIWNMLYRQ